MTTRTRAVAFLYVLLPMAWGHASAQPVQAPGVAQEFESLHFRSIGPATMSGRVADLAVLERNPAVYYVATAHGGVWKTTSNGAMFTPLFQDEGLISTGAVTISQRTPDVVWVGAGESNNRQSTSWGGGVFKSTDGGTTFQRMGLENSRHINRIVIDPANDDVVLVAATGPLFGPGGDRGIFKTTDGGRTWRHVLRVDAETGANDLVMAKTDARILYASTYQRRRNACCMNGGGPGSGIWKSMDGGDTWTRLTSGGLPAGPLGRIALDVFRQNANTVYALIEGPGGGGRGGAGAEEEPDDSASAAGQRGGGRGGRGGAAGGRGGAGDAGGARGGAGGGATPGVTGVYRSDDGGTTWTRLSGTNPRPMYFSQIRIDPGDPDRLYLGGVGMHLSIDGGRNFATDAAQAIHDDVHAIWIDPSNSEHILIGNDGGVAVSYDRSRTWTFIPNLPAGLFYHVSYDMEYPYNVCGGMQDNYNWCGPSASRHNRGIMNYDWFQIQGGDGFVAMPDLRDSRIVYTESQGGNMIRRNKITGESKSIRPSAANVVNATEGEDYRWNWDTPLIFSPHDPGVLLAAAQRVFRSVDRGDSWTAISPDLTTGANRDTIVTMGLKNSDIRISRNDGISNWSTIVSLAESPRQPNLYYAGSDDGVVSVSRDGRTWQNITRNLPGFPAYAWVSEVVPSRFEAGRVYVTADNHLANDYAPYVWVSEDFGATFRAITSGLSGQNVRTLTEDQRNADVLYVGTETGIFLSLDRGRTWRRLKANLPTVRVDEIALHPRDNAMLVATHGRSLFILDHLEPIQEYTATRTAAGDAKLFTIPTALQWKSKDDRNDEFWGHQFFVGENPPTEAVVHYNLKTAANALELRVWDTRGNTIRQITAPASRRQPGIRAMCWDMRYEPVEAPRSAAAGRGGAGGGAAGGGGRGGAGGGGRGGQGPDIPGIPTPLPTAGYLPADPCDMSDDDGEAGGGGGGGGGRGGFGGGATAGPYVAPGTYNIALYVNGTMADSRPLRIVMDPAVELAGSQRATYDDILLRLHELQRRGSKAASKLDSLNVQVTDIGTRITDMSNVPANVKSEFASFRTAFEAMRGRFGVPLPVPGAGGGGRGGGRGGSFDPDDVLARTSTVKNSILSFWEAPAPSLVRQADDVGPLMNAAITEANVMLARARTLSQSLGRYDITLNVPADIE